MIRRVSSCSGVAGGTHHLHLGEADTRTDSYGLVSLCPSGHTSSTTPRLRSTEMMVSAPRRSPTFTTRPPGWRTALLEPSRSLATSQAGDDPPAPLWLLEEPILRPASAQPPVNRLGADAGPSGCLGDGHRLAHALNIAAALAVSVLSPDVCPPAVATH